MAGITIEKIIRETDKAVLIACEVECCAGRQGVEIWFPKSRSQVDGARLIVEDWLAKAKLEERFSQPGAYWFN